MAAIDVIGYLLLGLGPGAAAYVGLVGRQSFVALLTLFSAFLWLAVMLVTSALLRGFAPLPRALGPYAGALLAAVAIEEAARYGVWRMHRCVCAHV
jgi:anterior pharynx defective protein 1